MNQMVKLETEFSENQRTNQVLNQTLMKIKEQMEKVRDVLKPEFYMGLVLQ